MKTFRAFFVFEFKRFFGWRNSIILVLFFLISMYIVHDGVQHYDNISKNKTEFQEIERKKVETFRSYAQYGGYGFQLYFITSPLNALFYNSSRFSELIVHIDVGEKLNTYNSYKGKNIFSERQDKFLDFFGAVLLLGSLMVLFYGYDFLRHREYRRFIASLFGCARSFLCFIVSNVILLFLYFIGVSACAVILLKFELKQFPGVDFQHIAGFMAVMFLVIIFFFFIGTIFGITGSKFARFFIIAAWVGSIYFAPAVINKSIQADVDKLTSNYQFELEKLDSLMRYEKRAAEEFKQKSKDKSGENLNETELKELIKDITKSYLDNEFKRIRDYDKQAKEEMDSLARKYQNLSMIFPSTFYLSVNDEVSSNGYRNLIALFDKAREIKTNFVKFYVEKIAEENAAAMTNRPRPKVEFFLKGDENIIEGRSMLPVNFGLGILITIAWIMTAVFVSYLRYRKALRSLPKTRRKEKIISLEDVEIDINRGVSHAIISRDKILGQHLYNVLSGMNKEFKGKILFNGVDIAAKKEKHEFVYLCHTDVIPWIIKMKSFVSFIVNALNLPRQELQELNDKLNIHGIGGKYFNELKENEKGRILFECALLKECSIYLIDDFARGMPASFIKQMIDRIQNLKQKNVAIIYITNDILMAQKIGDYVTLLKRDAEQLGIKA